MDAEGKFRFEETNETVKERLDKFETKLKESMTGRKQWSSYSITIFFIGRKWS